MKNRVKNPPTQRAVCTPVDFGGRYVWIDREGGVYHSRVIEASEQDVSQEAIGLTEADMRRAGMPAELCAKARELDTSWLVPNCNRPVDIVKPEEGFQTVYFEDELRCIDRMGRDYRALLGNTSEAEAFWFVLAEVHPGLTGRIRLPEEAFYDSFRDQEIKWAGRDIGDMISEPLAPFKTELSRHSFERVCLQPGKLLLAATETPMIPKIRKKGAEDDEFPPDPDETDHGEDEPWVMVRGTDGKPLTEPAPKHSIEYRKYWGCRVRLAIALQYLRIGLFDPDEWSSDDLLRVDELSYERLFLRGADHTFWVLAMLDARKHFRVSGEPRIFLDARSFNKARRRAERGNGPFFCDRFLCRVAQVNGKRFYIWVDSRWKEKRSTLLKLERGRKLTDRRGWKYVVLAVEENGKLRAGTLADAEEFACVTRERLWVGELILGKDEGGENPSSNPHYHDVKVVGRIVNRHGARWVSAQCEQLVLGLVDHFNTLTSDDSVNHDIYRGQQIVEHICPKWFPFSIFRLGWPKFPKPNKVVKNGEREKRTMKRFLRWWRNRADNAHA